jgi:ABC-type sulfate transport system permease component
MGTHRLKGMRDAPPTRPATFQPRFTLSLLYLFGLFFVYCLLLVAPELSRIVEPAAPGQEEAVKQAAAEVARQALRPRLPYAFAAAVLTLLLGSHYGFLPGLRPRPRGRRT